MWSLRQAQRISLGVQWLKLCPCTAWGVGSTPGLGTKIPHASQYSCKIFNNNNNLIKLGEAKLKEIKKDKAQKNLVTVMAGQRFENNFSGLELKTETETNMMK